MNTENIPQYVNPVKEPKPLILITAVLLIMTAVTVLAWNFEGIPDTLASYGLSETPVLWVWSLAFILVMIITGKYAFRAYFRYTGVRKIGVTMTISVGLMLLVVTASLVLIDVL